MYALYYIILMISTVAFSLAAVGTAYFMLTRLAMFDTPSERSNHQQPVPTGAGVAFMIVAIGFLMVAGAPANLLVAAALLLTVSFVDDMRSLPVLRRLGVQLIAVITALPELHGHVFQGVLPLWLDRAVVMLIWMWFINLYNFMDGIDGISISETAAIGSGLAILGLFVESVPRAMAIDALIIVSAVVAFYPWNKHPAKLFMGDSGSVTLGFLMGFLLFSLATHGQWAAALILPAYYVSDATFTLIKRLIAGKKIWQAHSEHAYQRAVRSGRSHDQVVFNIQLLNAGLVVLAVVSAFLPKMAIVAVLAAYFASAVVMARFRTLAPVAHRETPSIA